MPQYPADVRVLNSYRTLVSSFCEFLTIAVHTILYERDIYPRASFLPVRRYDYPVRQSRHPKVCKWILDAVKAVEREMLKGTVAQTSLLIYSPSIATPLERFVFNTAALPIVPVAEILTPFEGSSNLYESNSPSPPPSPSPRNEPRPTIPKSNVLSLEEPPSNTTPGAPIKELNAQYAAVLARLSTLSAALAPLPAKHKCTYTLAIELRENHPTKRDPAPRYPKPWIPSAPGMQKPNSKGPKGDNLSSSPQNADTRVNPTTSDSSRGSHLTEIRTTPVRKVDAGPFLMEVWIEEGKQKVSGRIPPPIITPTITTDTTAAPGDNNNTKKTTKKGGEAGSKKSVSFAPLPGEEEPEKKPEKKPEKQQQQQKQGGSGSGDEGKQKQERAERKKNDGRIPDDFDADPPQIFDQLNNPFSNPFSAPYRSGEDSTPFSAHPSEEDDELQQQQDEDDAYDEYEEGGSEDFV